MTLQFFVQLLEQIVTLIIWGKLFYIPKKTPISKLWGLLVDFRAQIIVDGFKGLPNKF